MAFLPSRTKYRKVHKGRIRGNAKRGDFLAFGDYGIQSLSRGKMTSNQIEASRVTVNRYLKRKGKLWINVFPHIPVTSKPTEVRMGKGKGSLSYWCCPLKPGTLLFELDGVSLDLARQALILGANKLPFKTKFIVNYTTIK